MCDYFSPYDCVIYVETIKSDLNLCFIGECYAEDSW